MNGDPICLVAEELGVETVQIAARDPIELLDILGRQLLGRHAEKVVAAPAIKRIGFGIDRHEAQAGNATMARLTAPLPMGMANSG